MSIQVNIHHVSKKFDFRTVIDDVSISIKPGESFVILGGSGAGKSVMLKMIVGLISPDDGIVKIGDRIVNKNLPFRDDMSIWKDIGYLFQENALFDWMTLWENVGFMELHHFKKKRSLVKELAIEKLSMVGIKESLCGLYPHQISGGMQKRVGIARAIFHNPKLILFDEPTSGLDPIISSAINQLTLDMSKNIGATAITITHDIKAATAVGDRIGLLYRGKFIWCGTREEFANSDDPAVIQFSQGLEDGPLRLM